MLPANLVLAVLEVIKGKDIDEVAVRNFTTTDRVLEVIEYLTDRGLPTEGSYQGTGRLKHLHNKRFS